MNISDAQTKYSFYVLFLPKILFFLFCLNFYGEELSLFTRFSSLLLLSIRNTVAYSSVLQLFIDPGNLLGISKETSDHHTHIPTLEITVSPFDWKITKSDLLSYFSLPM